MGAGTPQSLIQLRARQPVAWLAWAAVALAALALPSSGAAAPPSHGVLVPGKSLGGLTLGMTTAEAKARWGNSYGRCRNCFRQTWYFTYQPFKPQGAGVVFDGGRVVQVFTLWQPPGWHTVGGLTLGSSDQELTTRYGTLPSNTCGRYTVQTLHGPKVWTVFYVYSGAVWGFGLTRPETSPCL